MSMANLGDIFLHPTGLIYSRFIRLIYNAKFVLINPPPPLEGQKCAPIKKPPFFEKVFFDLLSQNLARTIQPKQLKRILSAILPPKKLENFAAGVD